MHHINTEMAFLEGVRCAQGLSQAPYFARRRDFASLGEEQDEAGGEEDEGTDDTGETDAAVEAEDNANEAPDAGEEERKMDLSCLGEDFGERMEKVGQSSEQATMLILRVLGRAGEDLAMELITIWDAFGHFCRVKLGVQPERALEACGYPATAELLDMLKLYAHVKAEAEGAAEYREALCRVWGRRFGIGQ